MDGAFLGAYCSIDRSMTGVITKADLVKYQKENNYEETFVTKWFRLFDRGDTGKIRVEEFCEVLGLEVRELRAKHAEILEASDKSLPSDCHVIYTDMPNSLQYDIFQIVLEANQKFEQRKEIKDRKDIAQYVKQQCDIQFERVWHSVMVRGQYWAYYSHEPENSFIFKYADYIYLIWRTPAP